MGVPRIEARLWCFAFPRFVYQRMSGRDPFPGGSTELCNNQRLVYAIPVASRWTRLCAVVTRRSIPLAPLRPTLVME